MIYQQVAIVCHLVFGAPANPHIPQALPPHPTAVEIKAPGHETQEKLGCGQVSLPDLLKEIVPTYITLPSRKIS